jgi:hypothetical protein
MPMTQLLHTFSAIRFCPAVMACLVIGASVAAAEDAAALRSFLTKHCVDCHQGTEAEAGLDLTTLGFDLTNAAVQKRWVRIFDRVHEGEMPPRDVTSPPALQRTEFLKSTGDWLRTFQRNQAAELGRVRGRRLTRRELERSLQDLLGIDIPLADQLPEEPPATEFSTVADGQAMSHFQLAQHLTVVDVALDEALRRASSSEDRYEEDFNAHGVARRNHKARTREPEIIDDRAVVWSSGLIFYGRIPATTAPENGWYRFRVTAGGLKTPKEGGVWTTIRSGLGVSSAPLLAWIASFEATDEPKEIAFAAWLPKGHMLEIRPGDITLKRARFNGGQVGSGEGEPQNVPGIAIDRITMQRFHRGPDNDGVRKLLFADVPFEMTETSRRSQTKYQPTPSSPKDDAVRLLTRFASRAFRRPVAADDIAGYVDMVKMALTDGQDFVAALRVGYRAVLCSPRFLYLTESPGRLDDHAIATRLSYLLTGSAPDARLTQLADEHRLQDAAVRHAEVERLLAGDGGRRFVQDFAAEWLDLDQIDFTEPDGKLYPQFDAIVQHAMLAETHTYLETMLRDNLGVAHLVDSDFTFLNSRLARHYDIDGIDGDALQRVALKPEQHRGGVLTQGAILKVTANGSNTSPVVRGVWVSERLLGVPIPPPPDNVPAIEPDIRGATTIRDMLAKHRSQESCAVCHVKIDPPGFALENYDPAGQWRDRYIKMDDGKRSRGPEIDPGDKLPDGREFHTAEEFRKLVAAQPDQLARCVAEKLLVYGTGAPLTFADREAVDRIAEKSAAENYGFRSILHAVVDSDVFLSK